MTSINSPLVAAADGQAPTATRKAESKAIAVCTVVGLPFIPVIPPGHSGVLGLKNLPLGSLL
jgi:hypothetical protein